jgi:hypothetical protein
MDWTHPKEFTMSTRKTATAQPAAAPLLPSFDGFGPFADLPRQQAALAAEAACAVFRGFESMRRVQEEAAHQALLRHGAAADKLKLPLKPMELLALETNLTRFDIDAAARYWQGLAAAAMEMQTELATCCAHMVNADKVLESAHILER